MFLITSFFSDSVLCAGDYANAPAIVAGGALMTLIGSLASPDFLCQRYAALGVGNLACNPVNQMRIIQEGSLPPLISLAKFENGDLESQR